MGEKRQRRKKRTKLTEEDEKMFKLICQMELPLVADKLGVSEGDIYQRFYWMRKKRKEWQRNINLINNAEKMCPKLEKMLTSSDLKT